MAKFCTNCGATLSDDRKFCTECGTPLPDAPAAEPAAALAAAPIPAAPAPAATPAPAAQPPYAGEIPPAKGSKFEPITTKGYIGIMLLMCIPIVGLILMIVWACGGCKKINKKNFARATLIVMAVSLVLSLILGLVFGSVAKSALASAGLAGLEKESSGLFGGSDSAPEPEAEESSGGLGELGELAGLLGGLGGLTGGGEEAVTNRDIEELEELGKMLEGLEGLTGEENGFGDLVDGAAEANREAEALNDGWPKTLRPYPGGSATAVASYRTEISGTTREEMMGWIEDLKGDGFTYQDFYDFGMSEDDMLGMDGWWAYDGRTYLSVSYYDGIVTVDHTKELPDLASYFS